MPFCGSFGLFFVLCSLLFPLFFLFRRSSDATTEGQFVRWHPPTVPTADVFFSPCTFPMVYPFGRTQQRKHHSRQIVQRKHHRHSQHTGGPFEVGNDSSLCHINRHIPFICDLHRVLASVSDRDTLRLSCVHQRHAAVLRDNTSSSHSFPTFVVLIVRQLAQPLSQMVVTNGSAEFGCLFRFLNGSMSAKMVQRFVSSSKEFVRMYASVLLNRWCEHRCNAPFAHRRLVLAIGNFRFPVFTPFAPLFVLLEGLITNPKRITSVTLHTNDPTLSPYLQNAQFECTNMLIQGNPLIDVLIDLTNRVGFAIREFHLTNGKPRQHAVPGWAWQTALAALSLVLLALVTEWAVVRRVRTRKMRAIELGGIKAAIKSKTHIIF